MLTIRLALALLLSAGAVPLGIAPAAAAPPTSGTICVALVVDARSIGGPVDTDCATVNKGATGLDVLQAAGHTLTFREDHLLCTIDGLPKTGCSAIDDTHFWAYYHRAPASTSWSYSTSGAGSYQPVNDSTDGWVYDDGTKTEPDNVPYAAICKAKATPSPTPKPTQVTHPTKTRHPSARGSATPSSTPSPTASRKTKRRHERHHQGHAASSASPTSSLDTPLASQTANPVATHAGGGSSDGGHGTIVGVIVAAVIIGGLGAAALASNRRRRRIN